MIAEKRYVREFAVTQDGKRIAMVTAIDDTVVKSEGESRVDVWDAETDKVIVTPPTDVYRAKAASAVRLARIPRVEPGRHAVRLLRHLRRLPGGGHRRRAEGWEVDDDADDATGKAMHVRGYGSPLKWTRSDVLVLPVR